MMWKHIYRDIAGLDMSYDESKDPCTESRKEDNHIYFDRPKKKNEKKDYSQ